MARTGGKKKTQQKNHKPNNPFQTAPRYLFRASNAEQRDSPRGPSSLQWTEVMWKAPFPIHFLARWLSTTARPASLPQTCKERPGQPSGRKTTNYLTHWGLWMGFTPHVSEERKHCLRLVKEKHHHDPPKPHSKNPPKACYEGKSGGKRVQWDFIHNWSKKSRGC